MIEIEKGIPVPDARKKGHHEPKFPWKEMQVGDSFVVPNEGKYKDDPKRLRKSFQARFWGLTKDHGVKFRVDFDEAGVLRCWRVE